MIRALVSCESSGIVRSRLNAHAGVYAMSCDLLPADDGCVDDHYQGDVRDIIDDDWDLLIAFVPCTYTCSSGLHWNKRRPERAALTEQAIDFARLHIEGAKHIPFRALENPIGCLSTRIRKPNQIIHPWQFGEDASKATCLWLENLPPLEPTNILPGGRKARRANQTASGQNRLPPTADRWKLRSATYPGIGNAMADQWIQHILWMRGAA
jgi:hypothetical protein